MPPRNPFPGPHDFHSGFAVWPLLAGFLLLLALLSLTGWYLWRRGGLPLPALGQRRPEEEAKRILAERFARGDLSTEEFLERSSILNWSPGVDPARPRLRRR